MSTDSMNSQIVAARKKMHARVISLYAKGKLKAEIARAVGLTPQRVGQIINKSKEGGK